MENSPTYNAEKLAIAHIFQSHASDCESRTFSMTESVRLARPTKAKVLDFSRKKGLSALERFLKVTAGRLLCGLARSLSEVSAHTED
jgi:hypothetical protein